MNRSFFFCTFLLLCLGTCTWSKGEIWVESISLEYLPLPALGIDVATPRCSWILGLSSSVRGFSQDGYQIIATNGSHSWDSGKICSSESSQIVLFDDDPEFLAVDTTYELVVHVWYHDLGTPGGSTIISEPASFDTGADFSGARWIGGNGMNIFRKEFKTKTSLPICRGRAFVSGLGYYELSLNGESVNNGTLLDPAWTTYNATALYSSYNVTSLLDGRTSHAIGVLVGNGWFAKVAKLQPRFILVVTIEYCDPSVPPLRVVSSPDTWMGTQGPITYDDVYNGENYTCGLYEEGWDLPNFHPKNSSRWSGAQELPSPAALLKSQLIPPIRAEEKIMKPISITQPNPAMNTYVYDFGQNFSGICKLKNIRATTPHTVTIRHAELILPDGSIDQFNLRTAKAMDSYTMCADGMVETFLPHFTYHGFQYVELSNYPTITTPDLDTIECYSIKTDVQQTGFIDFYPESLILNQIENNVIWGQKSNLMGIPTDCNQRDERNGWLADAGLTVEEALFHFPLGHFYTKFALDIVDTQVKETGAIPDTVPKFYGRLPADPFWGSSYPQIVYAVFKHLNDLRIVQTHYPYLKKFFYNQLVLFEQNGGFKNFYGYYGDWVPPTPELACSVHFTSGFAILLDLELMINFSLAIQYQEDAEHYQKMLATMKSQFHSTFFKNGFYDNGDQTSSVLALYSDVVPPHLVSNITSRLLDDIVEKHGIHLTTGVIGTKYLPLALSKCKYSSLALKLALQTSYPSWGWTILETIDSTPATTLWEQWDAPELHSFNVNSRNHIMYGAISAWFFSELAGIQQKTSGYKNLLLSPPPGSIMALSELSGVTASIAPFSHRSDLTFDNQHGRIYLSWKRNGGTQILSGYGPTKKSHYFTCGSGGGVFTDIVSLEFSLHENVDDQPSRSALETQILKNCISSPECWLIFPDDSPTFVYKVILQCSEPSFCQVNTTIPYYINQAWVDVAVLTHQDSVAIRESFCDLPVWQNNTFIPGCSGVVSGEMISEKGGFIRFSVLQGMYSFFTQ